MDKLKVSNLSLKQELERKLVDTERQRNEAEVLRDKYEKLVSELIIKKEQVNKLLTV